MVWDTLPLILNKGNPNTRRQTIRSRTSACRSWTVWTELWGNLAGSESPALPVGVRADRWFPRRWISRKGVMDAVTSLPLVDDR
jgi:hypothetical protein